MSFISVISQQPSEVGTVITSVLHETEAQRGSLICQGHTVNEWWSQLFSSPQSQCCLLATTLIFLHVTEAANSNACRSQAGSIMGGVYLHLKLTELPVLGVFCISTPHFS